MMWAQRFWLRLQTLFRRNRSTRRLNDEIRFHLDQQIAENIASGMSPEEARYAARRAFGYTTFLKEETRNTWGWIALEHLGKDGIGTNGWCRGRESDRTYACSLQVAGGGLIHVATNLTRN